MEDVTDAEYIHGKRVCKDFEIKHLYSVSSFLCSKQHIIFSRCI